MSNALIYQLVVEREAAYQQEVRVRKEEQARALGRGGTSPRGGDRRSFSMLRRVMTHLSAWLVAVRSGVVPRRRLTPEPRT
jgi:hypothetical protein